MTELNHMIKYGDNFTYASVINHIFHVAEKVMDAENQKAESGREHQKRATLFNAAEQKVILLL
jgi:hypothetical protein